MQQKSAVCPTRQRRHKPTTAHAAPRAGGTCLRLLLPRSSPDNAHLMEYAAERESSRSTHVRCYFAILRDIFRLLCRCLSHC